MSDKLNKKSSQIHESKSTRASSYIRLLFIKSIGALIGIQLIVFGFIMNFLIVYTNNLPPAWFSTFAELKDKNFYYSFYLIKPWAHLSTFMIGLLAGSLARCLINEKNKKLAKMNRYYQQQVQLNPFNTLTTTTTNGSLTAQSSPSPSCSSSSEKFNKFRAHQSNSTLIDASQNGSTTILTMSNGANEQNATSSPCTTNIDAIRNEGLLISWLYTIMPIVIMLTIVYSTFSWSTQELPNNFVSALYDSMSRILWSSCLSFMLIRWTTKSHKQLSNQSSTAFESTCLFLGRLSLVAYLISPLINNFLLAVQEQAIFSSLFIIFHLIVGNTLIIYSLSFLIAILIEQPLTRFVACAFGTRFSAKYK